MPVSSLGTGTDGIETEEALLATPQLLMTLRRLRLQSSPRLLWIDQLCINQDNLEERGFQVQLMGSIYRAARRVITYLGEDVTRFDEADSDHILDLIRLPLLASQKAEYMSHVMNLVSGRLQSHLSFRKCRNEAAEGLIRAFMSTMVYESVGVSGSQSCQGAMCPVWECGNEV